MHKQVARSIFPLLREAVDDPQEILEDLRERLFGEIVSFDVLRKELQKSLIAAIYQKLLKENK